MTFIDFMRDTSVWQLLRLATGGRTPAFQYFDEQHPLIRRKYMDGEYRTGSGFSHASRHSDHRGFSFDPEKADDDYLHHTSESMTTLKKYGIDVKRGFHLVEFLPNDPENPRNWCGFKKAFVSLQICLLIVAVYAGASIYTVGITGIQEQFGVTDVIALLGLTLFVLGYGVGPMVWGPLSEIPQIGRNSIYIPALVVFTLIQIPTALATDIGMLLGFRFVAGFFGAPILGSGDGILVDMYASRKHTYAMSLWALIGICGPTLGPIVGGFAVEAKGWTWSIWILSWFGAFTLISLLIFLPETSADNILYRRTMRLRKVTGDDGFICEAQLKADGLTGTEVLKAHLVRPFTLVLTEPSVLFLSLYSSLTYGLMYIWFESLPMAYKEVYHFGIGTQSLALLGLIAGVLLTLPPFFLYYRMRIEHRFDQNGTIEPEKHLHPLMIGCLFIPASLVWFGWTAEPKIHWAIPIVGSSLFSAGALLSFLSILNYLAESYPDHVNSVFAGNELFTSMCGATFPLFVSAMYHRFDILGSSLLLAAIAVAFVPLPYILYLRGAKLRKHSSYARDGK